MQVEAVVVTKTFQSMQEVMADTQNEALQEQIGINIKTRLIKYRNPELYEKAVKKSNE